MEILLQVELLHTVDYYHVVGSDSSWLNSTRGESLFLCFFVCFVSATNAFKSSL